MPPLTPEEILDNLNTNAITTVAGLTTAINTAIAAMNALKDKASIQTDKTDEIFAAAPADVTLPSGDIVPNFAKVRADLTAAITAFTSVSYLEATAQAVDSAKLEGKTLATITSDIKYSIIGAAPALLDTLEEIAAALGDDDTAINSLLAQLSTLSTSLTALSDAVADKAPTVHEHDSRYYTKSQTDTAIGNATSKPTFTTDAVTNIAGSSVTLNGTISDFVDASSSLQYRFIYGPTTDMEEGATTWTTVSAIGAVSAGVAVALTSTTYYALMQLRDTNKPDSMGLLPVPADWAAERTSFLSGSEVLDSDSYIYLQGTGGTGYIAMNSTNVPSLINANIVSNEIVGSGAFKAISKPFDQDAGQGDFSSITPLTKIKANKLTVDITSTASVPVFTSGYDNLLSTGSKIIVDDGGTIKEVTAGTVTKTGSSPTYKYTLASTTPTLTNNPSSAYVGGQQTYIYSADNFAGKTLTVDASTTHQTMTVKSGSTAAIPIFVGTTSGLITTGQHILVEDGTWKDVVAGTVTMDNPSAGVYEYTIAGTTPALNSTPTSAKATGKLVLTTDTTGVITSGDTVSMNSGTGGANQNVRFGSVADTIKTASTESASFTCNYDYVNKFHKQNIYKDTTVSDITGWTTGTSLPDTLSHSQAIVTKSRVYLLGGHNGSTALSTVYTAPINTDGTLGTWTTGTSLPGALSASQAIVTKSRVYLLGGSTSGSTPVSTVYTAPINTDGTLGTWTTGTSLPGVLSHSQAIVTKSRVYLLGGHNASPVSTVYTAPINTDGTLGTWTTGTSLPGALYLSQAIVTKSRVYLLGGDNGPTHVSTVYTAPINTDGTLGTWTTGTSLPGGLGASQAIVTKSRVYLLGGYNASIVSTVYTAPINTDGTLGTWTTGTSLPGVLSHSQAIVTKSRVYLLGGHNPSPVSTVYTAPFADGWQILDNNYQYISGNYTCTLPTPALVQIPTEARKGELVVPTLTGFTKATDTISYVYTKTALPANSRSLAVRVDGTIADAVTSLEGVIYV